MDVICPNCSFYFAAEISGRRQQADCPQCGSFAGRPDQEGGLVVKVVCRACGLGYPVDVLAARVSLACSGCGAAPKQRDKKLLDRLGEVWRLRALPAPSGEALHRDATGRVNLDEMDIRPDLVARVPASVALAYRCVPIRYENGVLTVALADVVREGVLEDLAFVLRCTVHGVASPCSAIERELDRLYGPEEAPPPA